MDVSRAQLSNLGDAVSLVDQAFPWEVVVRLSDDANRPEIVEMSIVSDPGNLQPITSTVLAQIPVRQIASVAASALKGEGEASYRMLAKPRPPGHRRWPDDHYDRVARVSAWARKIGRPGGAAGAISEFWGVHHRTARRWLAQAVAGVRDEDRP